MKIIAHRGASFYTPENTMAAYELAMKMDVDGLETDVRITNDNKIVLMHDDTTARTGSKNITVENSSYEELKNIDIGSWFDDKFTGEKITLLEDFILQIPDNYELYIEIKSDVKITKYFYDLIINFKERKNKIVIFSFNYEVVRELKKLLPDFTILWIIEFGYNVNISDNMYEEVYKKIEKAKLDGISTFADINHGKKMADAIKKRKWLWNVWTVDNPFLAKEFKKLGVSSLSSNKPDWIIKNIDKI